MREKRKTFNAPPAGGSSLMAIFAILALTIFAVLCISTMSADKRLSDTQSQAVKGYYEADSRSEELLAQIRSGTIPQGINAEGNVYSWVCPISDSQKLCVRVMVNGDDYTVLQWNAVSDINWEPDDSLPVWTGD